MDDHRPQPDPHQSVTPIELPDPGKPKPGQDPGSALSRRMAWVLTTAFVILAIAWQNLSPTTQYRLIGVPPPPEAPSARVIFRLSGIDIYAKLFIKLQSFVVSDPTNAMSQVDAAAFTPEERLAAAVVAAELESARTGESAGDTALERIEAERALLALGDNSTAPPSAEPGTESDEPDPELEQKLAEQRLALEADIDAFTIIYSEGPDALDPDARTRLADRYGYVGRVALTTGQPATDSDRASLLAGGLVTILFLLAVGGIFLLALLVGMVVLVFFIIRLAAGKLECRAEKPVKGGSVYLEVYLLFLAGFLIMAVSTTAVSSTNPSLAGPLSVSLPWLLLLIPLWPLLRGASMADYRRAMGLHRGKGFIREIAAGVIGYLAAVPLFVVGVAITIVVLIVQEIINGPSEQVSNPILEMLAGADWLTIALILALTTIWAPLTEEMVFRGALFRHLRGYMPWAFVAVVSALLFAYMHSYGPLMVAPLIALGFSFAFMRHWRGSLIASMTAHALHNGTLMLVMLTLIALLGD